jgi:hypothetical protein
LDEANAVAKAKGQAAAMVSASALRAKLAGLMVEKVEVSVGSFNDCETPEQIVDKALAEECRFYPVTDDDRRGLQAILERHVQERDEFIASIKARPIVGSHPLTAQARRTNERARQADLGNSKWRQMSDAELDQAMTTHDREIQRRRVMLINGK